jgi:hypothetical protein
MPDTLNAPPLNTANPQPIQRKPPFRFTRDNARQYSARANAARWSRWQAERDNPAIPEPPPTSTPGIPDNADTARRLARVLKQLDGLDNTLDKCKEPKEWDMLTRAKERLFKVWVHLAGIPGPGNTRPPTARSTRPSSRALPMGPIEPAPQPVTQAASEPEKLPGDVTP